MSKPQQSEEDTKKCKEAERHFEVGDVFLVLFVRPSVIRIRNINLDGGFHQTDEGDKDRETEDGKTGGVLLPYIVEVYVGVFLLTDHQDIAL